VIEIGPEGGELGGQLLYSGPPDQLIKVNESPTAEALETHLKQ
jgi:excinuclease ABC subunit A